MLRFLNVLLLFVSILNLIKFIKIYRITKKVRKSSSEYLHVIDLISNFLGEDDNYNKYFERFNTYIDIIGNIKIDIDVEDLVNHYELSTLKLKSLFKDLIPEMLKEERDLKLEKLLC